MELHQFRQSPFCDKVRLVLAAKGLSYSIVEVMPGLGQLELFKLSGQRQVPVLVDGETVVSDSTAIALHLERSHPAPPLLPADPQLRAQVLLLEDWADTALAASVRTALIQAAAMDPALRSALLPAATPAPIKQLVNAVPGALGSWAESLGESLLGTAGREQLQSNLEQLQILISRQNYLVGQSLTLADLAVVAQLSLLRPEGLAVPGLGDNPLLEPLFSWREQILTALASG